MPDLSQKLLEWYKVSGRDLPWRVKGGPHPDPYVILVSEFMLQQTVVKTVIPYFHRFMQRFPTIWDLAKSTEEEVFCYWQGLGYYTRARSLYATAKIIVENYAGIFPKTRDEVLKLKGIGAYTASSFLALAFNLPETIIDGNVMRIMCRMYHLTEPLDEIMPKIICHAQSLTSHKHPADYASAIMDLGATVCTPRNPQCLICPWQKECRSKGCADIEAIPSRRRLIKKEKLGFVYLIINAVGQIFIRRRSEKGLLSGLYEFPWSEQPLFANAKDSGLEVTHTFTHFKLKLKIMTLHAEKVDCDGLFVAPERLADYPVSTLMRKVYSKSLQIK